MHLPESHFGALLLETAVLLGLVRVLQGAAFQVEAEVQMLKPALLGCGWSRLFMCQLQN